jgi:enterochelin esterase-like enzyme
MNPRLQRAILPLSILGLIWMASCVKVAFTPQPGATSPAITEPTPTQLQNANPQPTSTPLYESAFCSYSSGTISDVQVDSTLLTHPMAVKIYLPPCYSETRDPGYPVLYMLHGQTYDEEQWPRLGLLNAADKLITAGRIAPMIVVMPYDISWSAGPETSKFDEALLQELLPYVDVNFNTCSERACRAIGGLSRGGNWAVYLGFSHSEKFTAIGAHSAPLFYGEIQRMTTVLKTAGTAAQLPAIYIDVGNKDENLAQVMTYVALLKQYSVPYVFTEFQGYHYEGYWSNHVEDYLLWYSGEFTSGQ